MKPAQMFFLNLWVGETKSVWIIANKHVYVCCNTSRIWYQSADSCGEHQTRTGCVHSSIWPTFSTPSQRKKKKKRKKRSKIGLIFTLRWNLYNAICVWVGVCDLQFVKPSLYVKNKAAVHVWRHYRFIFLINERYIQYLKISFVSSSMCVDEGHCLSKGKDKSLCLAKISWDMKPCERGLRGQSLVCCWSNRM